MPETYSRLWCEPPAQSAASPSVRFLMDAVPPAGLRPCYLGSPRERELTREVREAQNADKTASTGTSLAITGSVAWQLGNLANPR
jgi:hypothetical protein